MKSPGHFFGAAVLAVGMFVISACVNNKSNPGDGGNPGDASADANATASRVVVDGYLTAAPWMGYGFTATDPGAATITPDCSNGCVPPFTGQSFCMHGTVTGRADYSGFAMLGWNVNQAMTTGAAMNTWAVPSTGTLTVTVTNPGNTPLRLQLQGTDPHSGSDRWCVPLVSGQPVAWSSFVTNCYSGGTPQDPLTPGTLLQQASVLVPGLQTDLPFDLCLVDVEIAP